MTDIDESSDEECAVPDEPTQPSSQQPEQLKPLSHLKKGCVWKRVSVRGNCINVGGGFSSTFDAAPSVSYTTGKDTHSFVMLCKNATWLLKGVLGKSVRKGDLKAVDVLNEIRKRFNKAAGIEDITAVAEDQDAEETQESCEDDKMDALDDIVIPVAKARAKAKVKPSAMLRHYRSNHVRCRLRSPSTQHAVGGMRTIQKVKLKSMYTKAIQEKHLGIFPLCICGRTASPGCYNMLPTSCSSRASKERTSTERRKSSYSATTPKSRTCTWNGISR